MHLQLDLTISLTAIITKGRVVIGRVHTAKDMV